MLTLFIDSSKSDLSVVLILDEKIVYQSNVNSCSKHSNFLMNEIVKIFESTNFDIKDLNNIVILNGPGSFTGVRVGVTVAKTLSYVLNNNIYCLTTLKALSLHCSSDNTIITVVHDKNDSSYVGIYNNDVYQEGYMTIDEVISKSFNSKINIISMGESLFVTELSNKLSLNNNVSIKVLDNYDYIKVVNYALKTQKVDTHMLEPIYLKKIDAEKNKNDC